MPVSVYTTFVLVCPASTATFSSSATTDSAVQPTSLTPLMSVSQSASSLGPGPQVTPTPSSLLTSTPTAAQSVALPTSPPTYTGSFVLVPITTTLTVNVFPPHLTSLDGYRPSYSAFPDVSPLILISGCEVVTRRSIRDPFLPHCTVAMCVGSNSRCSSSGCYSLCSTSPY